MHKPVRNRENVTSCSFVDDLNVATQNMASRIQGPVESGRTAWLHMRLEIGFRRPGGGGTSFTPLQESMMMRQRARGFHKSYSNSVACYTEDVSSWLVLYRCSITTTPFFVGFPTLCMFNCIILRHSERKSIPHTPSKLPLIHLLSSSTPMRHLDGHDGVLSRDR